LIDIKF